MERLYHEVAKNIDQLICESMERVYQATVKNLEQVVGEAVEKALADKITVSK